MIKAALHAASGYLADFCKTFLGFYKTDIAQDLSTFLLVNLTGEKMEKAFLFYFF